MTQLKTIRKFKCSITVCVVLSFALVMGCDLFCDLGLISFSFPRTVAVSVSHNHEEGRHDSGHRHDKQHSHSAHDHNSTADNQAESSEEEGCCDDLTQRFYSSLTSNTAINTALVPVQAFNVLAALSHEHVPAVLLPINFVNTKFEHLPNGPPGTSGQVIRVFISSFLI